MQYIRTIILLVCLCVYAFAKAQLSTNEKPVSFDRGLELVVNSKSSTPIVTTPMLDMAKIAREDEEDEKKDKLPRFGYPHKVNYDLNNSGTWYELPNGDKLWQLEVVCPNALSVNFCYDKFWIPEGGKFFVYSKDKKNTIGAFTSKNNKGDRKNLRAFATGFVYGDDVILEYYQPKEVTTDAVISIGKIVHGYRFVNSGSKGFGDAGNCHININCGEGLKWQTEKKAVALIVLEGHFYCTGSLINTTNLSETPFLLTAKHCIDSVGKNTGNNSSLDYTLFYWSYEAPECPNTFVNISNCPSTQGASVLALGLYSDFALLRLTEDPKNLTNYTPYYLGWDRTGQSGNPGVCIHHPRGDIKKISTVASQPISTYLNDDDEHSDAFNWRVCWLQGVVERGSSGSPLLNANHKVIGQLHEGFSNCDEGINMPDWYGKFNVSWIGIDNLYYQGQLKCWLDSLNTNVQTMEGLMIIPSTSTMNANQKIYSNIRIKSTGQLTVQSNVELMGNSRVIVESGGTLIINGGTITNADLVLKPGSTLQITNGGILETRNGFEAPIGAIVEILYGQII